MASVTGLTAGRMLAIEAASVVSGLIRDGQLVLSRRDGTEIIAGSVIGPRGPKGDPGDITVSPAGGALTGNYPYPDIAADAVTAEHISDALNDAAATVPSLRSLGTGALQAAPGNHGHGAIDWTAFAPKAGDSPFSPATSTVVRAEYKKFGPFVHVRIQKSSSAIRDLSGSNTGNFPNVNVMGIDSVPVAIRPTVLTEGKGRLNDSPIGIAIKSDGSVIWYGGFPRSYPSGSTLLADFVYALG